MHETVYLKFMSRFYLKYNRKKSNTAFASKSIVETNWRSWFLRGSTLWPIFLYQYIIVKYLSERSYLWNDLEIEFLSGLEKIFTKSSITVSVTSKGTGKVRHLLVQVDKGNKTREIDLTRTFHKQMLNVSITELPAWRNWSLCWRFLSIS